MHPSSLSSPSPFFFFFFFFLAFLVIGDGEKLLEKSGIACWNVSEMENFRKLMYKIRNFLKINEKMESKL